MLWPYGLVISLPPYIAIPTLLGSTPKASHTIRLQIGANMFTTTYVVYDGCFIFLSKEYDLIYNLAEIPPSCSRSYWIIPGTEEY